MTRPVIRKYTAPARPASLLVNGGKGEKWRHFTVFCPALGGCKSCQNSKCWSHLGLQSAILSIFAHFSGPYPFDRWSTRPSMWESKWPFQSRVSSAGGILMRLRRRRRSVCNSRNGSYMKYVHAVGSGRGG